MSYILEALKKLEQKREREEAPRLTMFSLGRESAPKRRLPWPYILSAVLLLNAVAIMWWISSREVEKGNSAIQQAAGRAKEAAQPAPGTVLTEGGSSQASVAVGVPVTDGAPLPDRAAGPPAATAAATKAAAPVGKDARTEGAGLGEAAASRRPLEISRLSQPSAVQGEKPPARQETPRERSRKAAGRAIEIGELPSAVRGALPEFRISGHAYSAEPQTRVTRINEKILQEGQELSPGLRVSEIVPDGVVFAFQGYLFRVGLSAGK